MMLQHSDWIDDKLVSHLTHVDEQMTFFTVSILLIGVYKLHLHASVLLIKHNDTTRELAEMKNMIDSQRSGVVVFNLPPIFHRNESFE